MSHSNEAPSKWNFEGDISNTFDRHIRQSIPFYDEIQRMVVELSDYFVVSGSTVYDLGSSTGETLFRLASYHRNKDELNLVGIESSQSMIDEARRDSERSNVCFCHDDILNVKFSPAPVLITSIFTLQFLPLADRHIVLQQAYDSLVEGGALILLEKTHASHPQNEAMWNELHWDFKERQGLGSDEILDKSRSLRGVLNPLTQADNIALLQKGGFERIETFFQWFNWTGFLATKNSFDT